MKKRIIGHKKIIIINEKKQNISKYFKGARKYKKLI